MRLLVLVFGMALLIAACGGDSGDESSDTTVADATETTATPQSDGTTGEDTPAATTTTAGQTDDGGGGDVSGVGVGTATIAGETYEFGDIGQPGLQCMPAAFGVAFLAALQSTDGNDGVMVVGIPFPGEEETAGLLPELEVRVGDSTWLANEERAAEGDIPAGSSQVDSYEINGNTITGTATFYDRDSSFGGDLVVEEGTFELTCADE